MTILSKDNTPFIVGGKWLSFSTDAITDTIIHDEARFFKAEYICLTQTHDDTSIGFFEGQDGLNANIISLASAACLSLPHDFGGIFKLLEDKWIVLLSRNQVPLPTGDIIFNTYQEAENYLLKHNSFGLPTLYCPSIGNIPNALIEDDLFNIINLDQGQKLIRPKPTLSENIEFWSRRLLKYRVRISALLLFLIGGPLFYSEYQGHLQKIADEKEKLAIAERELTARRTAEILAQKNKKEPWYLISLPEGVINHCFKTGMTFLSPIAGWLPSPFACTNGQITITWKRDTYGKATYFEKSIKERAGTVKFSNNGEATTQTIWKVDGIRGKHKILSQSQVFKNLIDIAAQLETTVNMGGSHKIGDSTVYKSDYSFISIRRVKPLGKLLNTIPGVSVLAVVPAQKNTWKISGEFYYEN